jgi:DNA-binding CsgD family transcriptional regulator
MRREPSRRDRAIALRRKGFTFQEIANFLSITRQRAHQLVNSIGTGIDHEQRFKRNRRILASWRRGRDLPELARQFGMTVPGVAYALRRAQEEER